MKNLYRLLLIFALAIVGSLHLMAQDDDQPQQIIRLHHNPGVSTSHHPRSPAWSPVYCIVNGDNSITVYAEVEAEWELTITDNVTGEIIECESVDLTGGYDAYLPFLGEHAYYINVTGNEESYSANI